MAVTFKIGDEVFEVTDYTVTENATPLAAGDVSGSVGTLEISIPTPDPDLYPNHVINVLGPESLIDKPVELLDTFRGFTLGTVAEVSQSGGVISLTCLTRLGDLLVYNVQALPFSGTLEDALVYYLSLAEVNTEFLIDDSLKNRKVSFSGWSGELWTHLKELAASQDCDISLVSGVILFRPLRTREAIRGRDLQKTRDNSLPNLAQAIEVYNYNNKPITNQMVYPPNGWVSDDQVLTVEADTSAEYVLNLSASLSSVEQPTPVSWVGSNQLGGQGSVYTVLTDNGQKVSPSVWTANGGRVDVFINADTTSITVRIRAARGLWANYRRVKSYSLALPTDSDQNLRPTLRVVGSGVQFRKEKVTIPTSVPPSKSTTPVGVTIDNPFISSTNDAYRMGTRAARSYAGISPSITGDISAINKRGDTGEAVYASYGEVQSLYSGKTYGEVETSIGSVTYKAHRNDINSQFSNEDINQAFGNVQGTRIYDPKTRRYYRITTGRIKPGSISIEADDDLLHDDIQDLYKGMLYSDVQAIHEAFSYQQVELAGLYRG